MLSKMPGLSKIYLAISNLKVDRKVLALTLVYLVCLIFLHWRLKPALASFFLLAGGVLGVIFLDLADVLFKISPSPFRNVLFQTVFVPFSFFVLTSSGSLFGQGLVLSIFLSMLISQWRELSQTGNLYNWFAIIKRNVDQKTQKGYWMIMVGIFSFLSLLFLI